MAKPASRNHGTERPCSCVLNRPPLDMQDQSQINPLVGMKQPASWVEKLGLHLRVQSAIGCQSSARLHFLGKNDS